MQRDKDCPVQGALDTLGGKWRMAIIYTLSKKSPQRFKAIERSVKGITPRMLIKELKELETKGIVSRAHFPTIPPTVEYTLTDFGETTLPIVRELKKWGKKQTIDDENSSAEVEGTSNMVVALAEKENFETSDEPDDVTVENPSDDTETSREPFEETASLEMLEEQNEFATNEINVPETDEHPSEVFAFSDNDNLETSVEPADITVENQADDTETSPEPFEETASLEVPEEDIKQEEEPVATETEIASLPTTSPTGSNRQETPSEPVNEVFDNDEENEPQKNTLKNTALAEASTVSTNKESTSDSKKENADEQEKDSPQQFSLF